MSEIDRRNFLKLMGVGAGTAATTGCYRAAELPEKLVPYVIQPEEITPGIAVSYASTCQSCSAGCGLHVTTREGRPVKLEGNPLHPVNRGKLCAKGQASIGLTYHPDRYQTPMQRNAAGELEATTWESATATLAAALDRAGGKVAVLGGPVGPTLSDLIDRWLGALGGGRRVSYEPFAHEALRTASDAVFGVASRPLFDLSDTDVVVDFGADSLGTWLSPVEHSRQLAAARDAAKEEGRHAQLIYVGPRLDETASSSDEWLPVKPGTEGILALGLARVAFDAAMTRGRPVGGDPNLLRDVLASFDTKSVASRCGVSDDAIRRIGRALLDAKRPAALPPGVALTSRRAAATAGAVLVLNAVIGAVGNTVQIPPPGSGPRIDTYRDVLKLIDAMKSSAVSVLVIHDSNPLYSLPPDAGFAEALEKVGLVVSTASAPDETSARADLVLPDHAALESWGDAEPRPGIRSIVQPTIRPLYDTRALGDTLLAAARASRSGGASLPQGSFRDVVEAAWSAGGDWTSELAQGGRFAVKSFGASGAPKVASSVRRLEFKQPQLEGSGSFVLLPVPSPLLGDGRGANLPWLQETPDPITKIAWQSWVEISNATAESLDVKHGDVLEIENQFGTLRVPVWPRGGVRDDVVVVATGQGHTVGRYASLEGDGMPGTARGVNVNAILPSLTDEEGGRAWLVAKADVRPTGEFQRLPFTQGTDNKRKRMLGESISLATLASGHNPYAANEAEMHGGGHGAASGDDAHGDGHGAVAAGAAAAHGSGHGEDLPHEIRRAFDPVDDAHDSPFKWGMTIDVDKCTGCSACVVACAIENNISQVGEGGVLRSRQMSWLRIERYVTNGEPVLIAGRPGPRNNESLGDTDIRNSPMLCQQCGAAPCEPVCPVIATYHTEQGLNGMVYNRCIGTRYCSNNCPYKVRRYNWFDYQIEGWPDPMPLMLNPDVTVRGQGVMEKCTFCIQRINRGRLDAKLDGEIVGDVIETACQQTCPSDAIVFGNLKDAGSRAVKDAKANAGRAYHALHVLNTRPSITYLAKVKRQESGAGHAAVAPDARRTQMTEERGSEPGSEEVPA